MNKGLFFLLVVFHFFQSEGISQKHDFMWLLGYSFADNPHDTGFGSSFVDFNTVDGNPIFYESKYKKIDFAATSANICNVDGKYLFSSNGAFIEGPTDELMENSDMLDGETKYPDLGQSISQGVLILPVGNNSNKYFLFHTKINYYLNYGLAISELYYSIIDMDKNGGRGKVVIRRKTLLQDTLLAGCLTAVKHANGRDWWLIIASDKKLEYSTFLITEQDVSLYNTMEFPNNNNREFGYSFFSNDGRYFVSALNDNVLSKYNIHFFNFDRCEGKLYNY